MLEDHPLSFVRGCLFNIHSHLPSIVGGHSSIRNPSKRDTVVTLAHLTWRLLCIKNVTVRSCSSWPTLADSATKSRCTFKILHENCTYIASLNLNLNSQHLNHGVHAFDLGKWNKHENIRRTRTLMRNCTVDLMGNNTISRQLQQLENTET
jgi:hypothetical protein